MFTKHLIGSNSNEQYFVAVSNDTDTATAAGATFSADGQTLGLSLRGLTGSVIHRIVRLSWPSLVVQHARYPSARYDGGADRYDCEIGEDGAFYVNYRDTGTSKAMSAYNSSGTLLYSNSVPWMVYNEFSRIPGTNDVMFVANSYASRWNSTGLVSSLLVTNAYNGKCVGSYLYTSFYLASNMKVKKVPVDLVSGATWQINIAYASGTIDSRGWVTADSDGNVYVLYGVQGVSYYLTKLSSAGGHVWTKSVTIGTGWDVRSIDTAYGMVAVNLTHESSTYAGHHIFKTDGTFVRGWTYLSSGFTSPAAYGAIPSPTGFVGVSTSYAGTSYAQVAIYFLPIYSASAGTYGVHTIADWTPTVADNTPTITTTTDTIGGTTSFTARAYTATAHSTPAYSKTNIL